MEEIKSTSIQKTRKADSRTFGAPRTGKGHTEPLKGGNDIMKKSIV